jgi:hypothetical protein
VWLVKKRSVLKCALQEKWKPSQSGFDWGKLFRLSGNHVRSPSEHSRAVLSPSGLLPRHPFTHGCATNDHLLLVKTTLELEQTADALVHLMQLA